MRVLHTGEIDILGVIVGQTEPLERSIGFSRTYNKFVLKTLTSVLKRKNRWILILIDALVSIALIANFYFNDMSFIWKTVNICLGILFAYTAIKGLFRKPPSISSEKRIMKIEGMLGSEMQSAQKSLLEAIKTSQN